MKQADGQRQPTMPSFYAYRSENTQKGKIMDRILWHATLVCFLPAQDNSK